MYVSYYAYVVGMIEVIGCKNARRGKLQNIVLVRYKD